MSSRSLLVVLALAGGLAANAQEEASVSLEELRGWAAEVSNEGRWGGDDQLGTLT